MHWVSGTYLLEELDAQKSMEGSNHPLIQWLRPNFSLSFFFKAHVTLCCKTDVKEKIYEHQSWKSPATDGLPWKPEQRLTVFYSCERLPSYKSFSNIYVLMARHCRRCSTDNLSKLKRNILLVPLVDEEASAPWQSQAPLFWSMQRM